MQGPQRTLSRLPVRVSDVISGAVVDCRWVLETHEIDLVVSTPDDLPVVAGDFDALRRAVVNLLDNAAKHGGTGGRVAIRGSFDEERSQVVLSIGDNGPGIHRSDLGHVFEPFYRGRNNAARAAGSGLGLSLVKHIVERHDGLVRIRTDRNGTEVIQ